MSDSISIIIPNYNGRKVLEENLPSVISNAAGAEVIIVDDASTDDSVKYLRGNFKNIKLIVQKKNKGFAATVNNGVANAKGEYVLLLNSDVSPTPNFIPPLLAHFKNHSDLFAVGIADNSYEQDGSVMVKGRGGAAFSKGFLLHFPMDIKQDLTLWVSGGSGLFSRKKFEQLGGFDVDFAPFYWEDIDLSYRAWKAGYRCIFEPKSKVNHYHEEGAIKKSKKAFYIRTISYKNQFLFVWKNITDTFFVAQHLFYLPYHLGMALLRGDLAFVVGFIKAALQIPQLILHYRNNCVEYKKTDREILNAFKK